MTLDDFSNEYDNLTENRKEEAWISFLDRLSGDPMRFEEFLIVMLSVAVEYEGDDYFGTEGMSV